MGGLEQLDPSGRRVHFRTGICPDVGHLYNLGLTRTQSFVR